MERLKLEIKKVLGLLLGLIVVAEGSFLMLNAKRALIEGIGGVRASTVQMLGVVIVVIGLLMVLAWLLKDLKALRSRATVYKILSILATIMFLSIMIGGLAFTLHPYQIFFRDGGASYGYVAFSLIAGQFFAISALSAMLWLRRERNDRNALALLGGNLGSIGMMAAGGVLIGCAAPLTADYLFDVGAGKMTLAGVVLIAIGAIGLIAWQLNGTRFFQGRMQIMFNVAIVVTCMAVAVASVYLSGVASKFVLGNFFSGTKLMFIAFASMLFMLAGLAMSSWLVREKIFSRRFLLQAIGMVAGLLLATAGVAVFGAAGETKIADLGTLPHGLILMFGGQIILLGGMATASWVLKDTKYFNFGFRKTALDLMMIMLMSIAVVDGIAALMVAAGTTIADIGYIRAITLFLFGAIISGLGLLSLLSWTFRENSAPPRLKRIEFLIFMFWTLMVVAAMVL